MHGHVQFSPLSNGPKIDPNTPVKFRIGYHDSCRIHYKRFLILIAMLVDGVSYVDQRNDRVSEGFLNALIQSFMQNRVSGDDFPSLF